MVDASVAKLPELLDVGRADQVGQGTQAVQQTLPYHGVVRVVLGQPAPDRQRLVEQPPRPPRVGGPVDGGERGQPDRHVDHMRAWNHRVTEPVMIFLAHSLVDT